jgi:hypothetical protein
LHYPKNCPNLAQLGKFDKKILKTDGTKEFPILPVLVKNNLPEIKPSE